MAINDFITSTLNLKVDQLDAFDCVRKDDILNIYITLRDNHPDCMYCNGKTAGKGYAHRSYNHLNTLIDISNGLSNFERFRARAIYCLNHNIGYSLTNHIHRFNKREGKPRGKYKKTDGLED